MIEKNGKVLPQITIRCLEDQHREVDGKQVAHANAIGWVETKEWEKPADCAVGVLFEGKKRRTTLPREVLAIIEFAVWSPETREYVEDNGTVLTYPNAFLAKQDWGEEDTVRIAEFIEGDWAPPTAWPPHAEG